jgi:hypothetical protein
MQNEKPTFREEYVKSAVGTARGTSDVRGVSEMVTTASRMEISIEKYGLGKPRRIVVRAKILP